MEGNVDNRYASETAQGTEPKDLAKWRACHPRLGMLESQAGVNAMSTCAAVANVMIVVNASLANALA